MQKLFELSLSLFSGCFVETVFIVSMPTFKIDMHFVTKSHKPLLFLDCGQKYFGLLAKIYQQGRQDFIPRVQRKFRGNDVFDRNISSYHFWSLSGKFFDVCQNFIFWSPLNFPEKRFFVFENSNHFCRSLKKTLRTFWTKTSPVCQISILHLKLFAWRKSNLRFFSKVCFS